MNNDGITVINCDYPHSSKNMEPKDIFNGGDSESSINLPTSEGQYLYENPSPSTSKIRPFMVLAPVLNKIN